jgi:hypothetical protein
LISLKVGECKTVLHNGDVKFQIGLSNPKGHVEILLDDDGVSDLVCYGISHLEENNHPGAVKLKKCLIDIALEVGKSK